MLVKRNWRKSRIIFLRKNDHLVQYAFNTIFQFMCYLSLSFNIIQNKQYLQKIINEVFHEQSFGKNEKIIQNENF